MKTKNLIAWQKWFDPFGDDEENFSDYHYDEEPEHGLDFHSKPLKAISTPMGIIPYTENTASSKIFNFWVGHTNFNITHFISDLIEKCNGVESLDVFTRYRFRIAIGKAFDESDVKSEITDTIYYYLDQNHE
jgi:hypothetical protein